MLFERENHFDEQNTGKEKKKMIRIYNAKDQIEANRLVAFLQEAEIPCYAAGPGSGEYMQITMGYSVFGMDIYVREEDAVRTRKFLEEFLEEDNSDFDGHKTDEELSTDPAEEKEEKIPWYKDQRVVGKIIVLIIAASLICKGIVELVMKS